MAEKSTHLGNRAYATVGKDGTLLITANDHRPQLATDLVFISEAGLEVLIDFIDEHYGPQQ